MISFNFERMGLCALANGLLLAVPLAAAGGCGDDDTGTGDAGCVGHTCPADGGADAGVDPFSLPEGGDVRIELIYNPDGTSSVAMQAFYWQNQTPAARALSGPQFGMTSCEDMRGGDVFENGTTPEAQQIADSREYIDMGASLTLTGNGQTYTLTRSEDTEDQSAFLTHDIIYLGDVTRDDIAVDTEYTVDGVDMGSARNPLGITVSDSRIYLPDDFTITPAVNSGVTLPATGDFVFTISRGDRADGVFLAFGDPDTFAVRYQCLFVPNDDGVLTIPQELIQAVDDEGFLLIGTFAHWANIMDGRRIDVQGINCLFAEYTKESN